MFAYIIWDVNPEIFSIGSFSIRWYGLLFASGFLIGQRIMAYIFQKEGVKESFLDSLLLTMVISTVVGARLGHFLFYEPEVFFKNPLQIITPPFAGLASHGATIGILLGLYFYARTKKMSFLWVVDRIVITVALGGCFIRLGNLMNSEIVGKVTDVPWAFVFTRNFEFTQYPRHPAQLYEAIACIVLCFLLFWLWTKKKSQTPQGLLLGIFLLWVFGLRFVIEFFKENQVAFENDLTYNMGQILSIPAVLLGFLFLGIAWKNRDKKQVVFTDNPTEEANRIQSSVTHS
ncbi:prolipoprotein diacylglyceryl transferase [Runella zeae]|jgi:phosphatidylglycerol:prolipoprotein diacylglycerol transferase|uniref:prolipoprotein diacylglyceryl transferase n=1 Tax=Runella zeae TaxID=94255 RepID=UPI0004183F23|nr:prolipoprotein diacylglyceryl transferase [Runella zeae]